MTALKAWPIAARSRKLTSEERVVRKTVGNLNPAFSHGEYKALLNSISPAPLVLT